MSLDVYLIQRGESAPRGSGIFVRENGQTVEISREEWGRRYPDREPVVVTPETDDTVFDANITHNLTRMAGEAGIYEHLWRPEELGIRKARDLIQPLRDGLALMQSDSARFEAFNPANGWGSYEDFLPWIANYLAACEAYPDAEVHVSR